MNAAAPLPVAGRLPELIHGLAELDPQVAGLDIEAGGIKLDSREVGPGDLFLATFGRTHDARKFIDAAVNQGAAAVLAESGRGWQGVHWQHGTPTSGKHGTPTADSTPEKHGTPTADSKNNMGHPSVDSLGHPSAGEHDNMGHPSGKHGTPIIAIDHLVAKASEIAGRFYRHPSSRMSVIGITGTNGKTTCSQFIARAFAGAGCPAGVIGTLGYGVPGDLAECPLTTPDAVFTQRALAEMAAAGLGAVAMEVSSVGLHQRRVQGVRFETAIFTNLTRDHLDYHDNMEAYGANKRRLFSSSGLRSAVVNLDDPFGMRVINDLAGGVEVISYGIANRQATVRAEAVTITRQGFQAEIHTPVGVGRIDCKLLGRFNVGNMLAVVGALLASRHRIGDIGIDRICELISGLQAVDGRMEVRGEPGDVTAVVDYSHTPDGLEGALAALREHFDGDLWCVFGCGGNRDKGKRPIMGALAEKLADHTLITDDNPRLEDGDAIVSQILSGMKAPGAAHVERDREQAIARAVAMASPGDVVLIAGKGHENYQQIGATRRHFSDAEAAREALWRRRPQRAGTGI